MSSVSGIYSPIAIIINFLMLFLDDPSILSFVLSVFKRLYNSFPLFRKNLEDPIVSVLVAAAKIFDREREALDIKLGQAASEQIGLELYGSEDSQT